MSIYFTTFRLKCESNDFTGATFEGYSWYKSTCKKEILKNSIITYACNDRASYLECDFENVKIIKTDFDACEFIDDNLKNAEMFDTKFEKCIFKNIDFTTIKYENVTFTDCQFENVTFTEQQKKDFGLE